jgi:hypothetical protein
MKQTVSPPLVAKSLDPNRARLNTSCTILLARVVAAFVERFFCKIAHSLRNDKYNTEISPI